MPDVAWTLGRDDLGRESRIIPRTQTMIFLEYSPHSCCAEVQPRPAKGISDSHLPHGGTKRFQAPHKIADKVGELVDRLRELQEGI
jgi:hypothetical protein